MPVDAELVALLRKLFGAPELHRLLQYEPWGADLVQNLAPLEHQPPSQWFHALVLAVHQRGWWAELRALLLRERAGRATEIWAVLPDLTLACFTSTPPHAEAFAATLRAVAPPQRPKVAPMYTRRAPQKRAPIRVLHLSDLHFSARAAWDQMPVLTSLVSEVQALCAHCGPIHRVVITGDIANVGTAKEYAKAGAWLNGPLAEAAGVRVNQIRMVPGNHDVERSKVNLAVSGLDKMVLSQGDATIALLMNDKPQRKLLLARQAAYRKFAKDFNPQDDGPGWRSEEEIEGWSVHLVGLNTAWLSGSHKNASGAVDDHRHLVIGGWQWNDLFPADRPVADLTIALMHHPWEDLSERESRAHREATYDRCGLILRGHMHDVNTLSAERDGRLVLEAAAGACYADPGDGWPHGFQLLELDPGLGRAKVHLRKWHNRTKRWIPDRDRYPNTGADGVIELDLRRSPNTPDPSPVTQPKPGDGHLNGPLSETIIAPRPPLQRATHTPARAHDASAHQDIPFDLGALWGLDRGPWIGVWEGPCEPALRAMIEAEAVLRAAVQGTNEAPILPVRRWRRALARDLPEGPHNLAELDTVGSQVDDPWAADQEEPALQGLLLELDPEKDRIQQLQPWVKRLGLLSGKDGIGNGMALVVIAPWSKGDPLYQSTLTARLGPYIPGAWVDLRAPCGKDDPVEVADVAMDAWMQAVLGGDPWRPDLVAPDWKERLRDARFSTAVPAIDRQIDTLVLGLLRWASRAREARRGMLRAVLDELAPPEGSLLGDLAALVAADDGPCPASLWGEVALLGLRAGLGPVASLGSSLEEPSAWWPATAQAPSYGLLEFLLRLPVQERGLLGLWSEAERAGTIVDSSWYAHWMNCRRLTIPQPVGATAIRTRD